MEELNNKEFETNPNLKFRGIIKEFDCCFGINDIFDIYYAHNENNELYLISPSSNYSILITRLRDNHLVQTLEGFNNAKINMIRYFYNKKDNKDYLIASFKGSKIKIWDLSNNYNLKHSIKINYSENTSIFSCLLYFSEKNGDYFITSSNSEYENDYTKIYNFNDGSLINNLYSTNRRDIYYLLLLNKDNNDYLIQCSVGCILIHNLENKNLSRILSKNSDSTIHNSACLIKSNDDIHYLYVGNVNGLIDVWDLNTFQLKTSIRYGKCYFYHLLSWNNRYIFVALKTDESIIIIDTYINRVISVFKEIHKMYVISLKKIIHPIYGESLLSSDLNNKLILWTHNIA